MLRRLVISIILLSYSQIQIQGVTIEYPPSDHIKERTRTDIDSIDPIFRHYIVPREIQFYANALQGRLPFFLKCKGSTNSTQFIVPPAANDFLSLDTDNNSHIINATLKRDQLRLDLVGRYTCSEIINDKKSETSVYVFIVDGSSVFTKRLYPKASRGTGIHFFNIPCQATSWYARMSCPDVSDSERCQTRKCTPQERLANELKCNLPICEGEEICIPVYYAPMHLQASKIFFDPQIGFALENLTISESIKEFTCMSNYTPKQISRIPYDSSEPEGIVIHQSSLTVMPYETVTLICEIQYGTKVAKKTPSIFWFEDIYDLNLTANHTENPAFNKATNLYSQNSSIELSKFKATKTYRFYCVRVSEQRIYSRSVDINCVDKSSLDLTITANKVFYGSDSSYNISIFTVPRWNIVPEITRNGDSLNNDKRFKLKLIADRDNQSLEYILTIKNITFEDETELRIQVKSSALEKSKMLIPVIEYPVGQIAFVPNQISDKIPWRAEDFKSKVNIYPYGIYENESYHVVCTIRHRSDIEKPLNVFIQQTPCSIDTCLSDIIDNTCQSTTDERLAMTESIQISDYQTQFASNDSQILSDPSIGHQYLCCYEKDGLIVLAKALTALARNREMFTVRKQPELGIVIGEFLTYGCEAHELIYDEPYMIYNDESFTYERNRFDSAWRGVGTNQPQNITWVSRRSNNTRDTAIEVKTEPLKKNGTNGFLQCIARSKRSDVIQNMSNTYIINVDDPVELQFENNLPSVNRIDRKASTNVTLDCLYKGRPQPKITWLRGKSPLIIDDARFQLRDNDGSIYITHAQASETDYYTCELTNGRGSNLTRSFDLRVKGPPKTAIFIIISSCLIQILLIVLIIIVRHARRPSKDLESRIQYSRAQSFEDSVHEMPNLESNINDDRSA